MRIAWVMAAAAAVWVQPVNAATWILEASGTEVGLRTDYELDLTGTAMIPKFSSIERPFTQLIAVSSSDHPTEWQWVWPNEDRIQMYIAADIQWDGRQFTGTNFFRSDYTSCPRAGVEPGCWTEDTTSQSFAVNFVRSIDGPGPVPEPATWAMLLIGFGAIGGAMRRRRTTHTSSINLSFKATSPAC